MMKLMPFQYFQNEFANHLRDPHHTHRPLGVNARRISVYNELLFNNICGFLDSCFPVAHRVLGTTAWRRLSRTFFRDWPLHTPLFRHIPFEFVRYLQAGNVRQPTPRWLPDLLHYEWAELAVDVMDVTIPPHNPVGDVMLECVVLNPARMDLALDWPVHLISPEFKPRKETSTFLMVYRDADDGVQFTALNEVTSHLIGLLAQEPMTGDAALRQLAQAIQSEDPRSLLAFGRDVLVQLQQQHIILGTKPCA